MNATVTAAGHNGHGQAAEAGSVAPGAAHGPPRPIPVTHQKAEPIVSQGADFGGWFTYSISATAAAQLIAPHDENRARMLIVVQVTGGTVWVGSKAQAQANPVLGGNLPPGTYELKNKQELWLAPDGTHAATVSTLIERYEGTR